MGRLAQGPMTMRLFPEQLAGQSVSTQTILVATVQGRIDASQPARCQRGPGEIAVQLEKNDKVQHLQRSWSDRADHQPETPRAIGCERLSLLQTG